MGNVDENVQRFIRFPVTKSHIVSWAINFSQKDVMREGSKENFDFY